jgi:hypothetical protein
MSRNFAVRFTCPHGDCNTWVTLSNREESFDQVLEQTWDFKCREHGPQRGKAKEVLEVAPIDDPQSKKTSVAALAVPFPSSGAKRIPRSSPRMSLRVPVTVYGFAGENGTFHEETETIMVNTSGGLVTLKTKLELGDNIFLVHRSSQQEQQVRVAYLDRYSDREWRVGLAFKQPIFNFWRRNRRFPRVPKSLRVTVKGTDAHGHRYVQSAYTIDLSQEGARLDGIGFLTSPGQTIEVSRHWRKANFRVIWIGQVGTTEANQVGIFGLQADKNIWPIKFSSPGAGSPSQDSKSSKK